MVSPIYLIIVPLAVAFFISFFDRIPGIGRTLSLLLFYGALATLTSLAGWWLYVAAALGEEVLVYTAGFAPPLSIALAMGVREAFFLAFANLAALGAAVVLGPRFRKETVTAMILFLMVLLGAQGIIMTRDLFNLFVFLEISSIATYSLIALDRNRGSMAAGFKYIIAGGIASAFILLGIIYLYRIAGSLAIDDIIAAQPALAGTVGFAAVFFVMASLLIELKPFPANGWALDVYQAAQSSVVSVIAVVNSAAVFYGLMKLLPMFSGNLIHALVWVGILTFFASNLMGLRQKNVKRMLGYSSSAQIGLLVSVLGLSALYNFGTTSLLLTLGALFIGHLLAKAGLFWLTELQTSREWISWRIPGGIPGLTLFGILVAALAGLPPFPAFWAKWILVKTVISGHPGLVVLLLTGSLFEAIYLLRWFGRGVHLGMSSGRAALATEGEAPEEISPVSPGIPPRIFIPVFLASAGLIAAGAFSGISAGMDRLAFVPIVAAALLFALALLPSFLQGLAAVVVSGAAYYFFAWGSEGISMIFSMVFYGGGLLFLIATLAGPKSPASPASPPSPGSPISREHGGKRPAGFYPFFTMLILALGGLVQANSLLGFFLSWELMTVSSYYLILMGKNAEKPALTYIGFSLGGAFLVMTGLVLLSVLIPEEIFGGSVIAGAFSNGTLLDSASSIAGAFHQSLSEAAAGAASAAEGGRAGAAAAGAAGSNLMAGMGTGTVAGLAFALLSLGFLTKIGAAGLHVWLPGAYAEADDDVTPLLSAVLSKAGIFGLIAFTLMFPTSLNSWIPLPFLLRWIGILTAFFGTMMAVFEEDIKRVFAYSSMGQLGYIVLAVGLMSSLGWTTAIYLTVLHLLFKGMLFLTAAGVVDRTGTRLMYQMGGLIKKMPVSFFSALLAIIALSGVPPLAGFGGKWLLYNALIENGHVLLAALAFFSSTIAFLYLFRFIYTVFLGQLKFEHRGVREAPAAYLLPQVVFIVVLMAFSMFPNMLIKPIQAALEMFPGAAQWQGGTLASSIGYWNGSSVMYVTMAVFGIMLVWLLLVQRKPQTVGQFNIVYAAERPERPETTHYGHNFFAPYRKALGFLTTPVATRFWNGASEAVSSIGGAVRRLYTGNGQTYALHILLFVTILYFLIAR